MEISTISYNPVRRDGASNRRLNGEWIQITNASRTSRDLEGWSIHDRNRDHVYEFTGRSVLGPGQHVYLHTGRGEDGSTQVCNGTCHTSYYTRYWGLDEPVWDNDGDRATLRNRSGAMVDRCRYSEAASSPKRC